MICIFSILKWKRKLPQLEKLSASRNVFQFMSLTKEVLLSHIYVYINVMNIHTKCNLCFEILEMYLQNSEFAAIGKEYLKVINIVVNVFNTCKRNLLRELYIRNISSAKKKFLSLRPLKILLVTSLLGKTRL